MFDNTSKLRKHFEPLVLDLKRHVRIPVREFVRGSWIAGNTTRAFRNQELGANTLVDQFRSALTSDEAMDDLRAVLKENETSRRLSLKLDISKTRLEKFVYGGRPNAAPYAKVKVIDLALKEFVFTLDGQEERFRNLDCPLDRVTLGHISSQLRNEFRKLPQNLSMGSICCSELYLAAQRIIRNECGDSYLFDVLAWNSRSIRFADRLG